MNQKFENLNLGDDFSDYAYRKTQIQLMQAILNTLESLVATQKEQTPAMQAINTSMSQLSEDIGGINDSIFLATQSTNPTITENEDSDGFEDPERVMNAG